MPTSSLDFSPDRWELVAEEEWPQPPYTLRETRWRWLVLRVQVRRHAAYLMQLAKVWRKFPSTKISPR
ncbi:hypothetical protein N9L68_06660 [bacterium]|nr:hypothetical protein [bacterium]